MEPLPSSTHPSASIRTLFIVLPALALASLAVRIYAQSRLTPPFHPDDAFLLAALVALAIYTATTHLALQTLLPAFVALRFWLLAELHYVVTVTLLRLAALIQLRRRASVPKQRGAVAFLAATTVLYNVAFALLMVYQCAPVQYFEQGWVVSTVLDREWVAEVSCVFAGVGAGTDWVLVGVAMWVYWDPDMVPSAVWAVRGLLGLGLCAGAAGLVRIPTTRRLLHTSDFFADCVPIAIGGILECSFGFIALSASAYKPLCPALFEKKPVEEAPPTPTTEEGEKMLSQEQDWSSDSTSHSGSCSGGQKPVLRKVSEERIKEIKEDA